MSFTLFGTSPCPPISQLLAMAADDGPTHFAGYCPCSDACATKSRLGWADSEEEARGKVYNHLLTSTYHELDEEVAQGWARRCEIETWGPKKEHQSGKKRQADAAPARPQKSQRAISDAAHAAGQASSSQPSSRNQQASSADVTNAWRDRAEEAEGQIAYIQSVMTRVVENLTKSAASCKTAARFARQAMDAFETEHHTIQNCLETIQAMYSAPAPAPVIQTLL